MSTTCRSAAAETWDVIVIGAGPAGSCAAYAAASSGCRVLLVDKANFPRSKVCGCCLAPAGQAALSAAGLGAVLVGAKPISRLTLHAGERSADLPTERYLALSRQTLDSGLIAQAASRGVSVLTGTAARVFGQQVCLTNPAERHTEYTLSPRCIVAADGLAGSSLAGLPEAAWAIRPGSRIGCGALLSRAPLPLADDQILMLTHQAGYVGMVRLPDGNIDTAAALCPVALKAAGGPVPLLRAVFRSSLGDATVLDGARFSGTGMLTRTRAAAMGNVLVAGDAAGYVEPFTGEGMSWAITTGLAAGACAAQSVLGGVIRDGGASGLPHTAARWLALHQTLVGRRQRACFVVAALTRHTAVARGVVLAANICPGPVRYVAGLLGGFGPARGANDTLWRQPRSEVAR